MVAVINAVRNIRMGSVSIAHDDNVVRRMDDSNDMLGTSVGIVLNVGALVASNLVLSDLNAGDIGLFTSGNDLPVDNGNNTNRGASATSATKTACSTQMVNWIVPEAAGLVDGVVIALTKVERSANGLDRLTFFGSYWATSTVRLDLPVPRLATDLGRWHGQWGRARRWRERTSQVRARCWQPMWRRKRTRQVRHLGMGDRDKNAGGPSPDGRSHQRRRHP
jgi:hypothetical protein